MSTDWPKIAAGWTRTIPSHDLRSLVTALRAGPVALESLRYACSDSATLNAIDAAREISVSGDGPYLAGVIDGLRAAAQGRERVSTVWTGPQSTVVTDRLTSAVVAELISESTTELLLAAYATYAPAPVVEAMHAAAERGVAITLLLERPEDNPKFHSSAVPFAGLPCRRLRWNIETRPPGASMHAKLLVVDRRTALIGSANFTGAAFQLNLECGVLIRGGTLPAEVCRHIETSADLAEN